MTAVDYSVQWKLLQVTVRAPTIDELTQTEKYNNRIGRNYPHHYRNYEKAYSQSATAVDHGRLDRAARRL